MLICFSSFRPWRLALGFPCWSFGFLHLVRPLVLLKFLLLALKFLPSNCLPKDSCEWTDEWIPSENLWKGVWFAWGYFSAFKDHRLLELRYLKILLWLTVYSVEGCLTLACITPQTLPKISYQLVKRPDCSTILCWAVTWLIAVCVGIKCAASAVG